MSIATFTAAQLLRLLPRARLSKAAGRLCAAPLPARVSSVLTDAYVRAYGVDMRDVEPVQGAYPSFDAFFTRPLRPGARTIASAPIVSPADGRVTDVGRIDVASRVQAKGQTYDVGELTGSPGSAASYRGGSFAVIYLSPRDYHRVHAPVDGHIGEIYTVPGDSFPVNWIGERHIPRLYARNHRVALSIETRDLGVVTVILVGAIIVGRITLAALGDRAPSNGAQRFDPKVAVRRGDELGTFHLGSTVIVLVPPGADLSCDRGPVRYGASLVG